MINLKTTALLGNITRQSVSKQLLPLSNSKNTVINLSQRTSQPVNNSTNPVRSFSSTQTSRENNPNNNNATLHHAHHSQFAHLGSGNTFGAHRLQSPLTATTFHHFPKDASTSATNTSSNSTTKNHRQHNNNGNKPVPKYSELSQSAWDAINGQNAHAVFPFLQEMHQQGVYADAALSNRIVGQFLDMNAPKDAERALSMLVDCHHNQGRTLSSNQKLMYTSLAKDIANHSSDLAQTLSLARLLERHGLLATAGFATGALRSYRQIKSNAGLSGIRAEVTGSGDVETLLTLQASLTKSTLRYKQLIELLLDAKEMNIFPSRETCSHVSHSFIQLGDYAGQLAWDTAVQELYPGFKPSLPDSDIEQQSYPSTQLNRRNHGNNNNHTNNSHHSNHSNNNNANVLNNGNYHANHRQANPGAQVALRNLDPSEAIVRACRAGYAAVALEEISRMVQQKQLPSPQALADTIQVCAKREKKMRSTDYQELYHLAMQSLETITDSIHRRASEYEVYNAMLVANATLGDMPSAKKNYDDIIALGQFPDATGYATLLIATTTGAVDEAHDALKILEEVKRHNIKPNIFFYNVVIGKLSRGRKIERVLEVYEEMNQNNIRPNGITYGTLISACTRVGSEDMARNLFKKMTSSPNYSPRQGPHNAMIQFYVRQKKDRSAALHYYEDMLARKLVPTEHTYTLLIEAFACIQPYDLTEANRLIQSMKRGPVRATEAHYGALIHAYGVEHRDVSTAELCFNNMRKSGIVPKGPAYQSLIESYITNNRVKRAVQMRNELLATGQPSSAYIENTLIRGYGSAHNIQEAENVFNAMTDPLAPKIPGSIVKEPSSYQSMITAYLENDLMDKAYSTLAKMKSQQYPELVIKPAEEAIHAATNGFSGPLVTMHTLDAHHYSNA
ncbi:hypothetical protein BG004_003773 [Podila humilis]|nr:hypothetical protein BG004_003773 [Podila humilis]